MHLISTISIKNPQYNLWRKNKAIYWTTFTNWSFANLIKLRPQNTTRIWKYSLVAINLISLTLARHLLQFKQVGTYQIECNANSIVLVPLFRVYVESVSSNEALLWLLWSRDDSWMSSRWSWMLRFTLIASCVGRGMPIEN